MAARSAHFTLTTEEDGKDCDGKSPTLDTSAAFNVPAMTGSVDNSNQEHKKQFPPTNVYSIEQIQELPPEFRNVDPESMRIRPLRLDVVVSSTSGSKDVVYQYSLRPLWYSAIFILLFELLEYFSFYGVYFTQASYVTGVYNPDWNAGKSVAEATSYVSTSAAISYTAPFIGGILADGFLGDFWEILFATGLLYIPGLLLISLSAYPLLFGDRSFPHGVLTAGMIVLWPLGAGALKSVVNVFGAKQFHPILQRDQIEQYYTVFYVVINLGALIGGVVIPIVAQHNAAVAYTIPLCAWVLGTLILLLGSRRYVRMAPTGAALTQIFRLVGNRLVCGKRMEERKISKGGSMEDSAIDDAKRLWTVIPVSALIIPFNMAYFQMATTFVSQGNVMKAAAGGTIDGSVMQNVNCISTVVAGFVWSTVVCPRLHQRGISLSITQKFAIGSGLGAMAILGVILIDYRIAGVFSRDESQMSVLWQSLSYVLIGAGEIFAIATSFEAAFTIAPKEQKGLASALNLFMIGAVPNLLCVGLVNACKPWFPSNSSPSTEEYASAETVKYLWATFGITLFGVMVNLVGPFKTLAETTYSQRYDAPKRIRTSSVFGVVDLEVGGDK